jgi:SAM-dependent methyltransferase
MMDRVEGRDPVEGPGAKDARSVRDEGGYNQGWTGGLATQVRGERRARLLSETMTSGPSRQVLEIGCGRGEIACQIEEATGMQVLGIDRSPAFVEEARSKASQPNVRFEVMDFTRPEDLQGRTFDYAVGNGILHHLYYNLPESLGAIRDLLAVGGQIMFLEPNLHNPYVYAIFSRASLRRWAKLEPDEMAFSRRFIINQLTQVGFSEIDVGYRDFLLPGVPEWMIKPSIRVGDVAEETPGLKHLAQSLFIRARR